MVTTLDKYGRVLIPKKIRSRLGLMKLANLNITDDGNRIIIELVDEKTSLVKRGKVLVFSGVCEEPVEELVNKTRDKRDNEIIQSINK